jgi:phosphoglycerate dehydrogenase-like enzyme
MAAGDDRPIQRAGPIRAIVGYTIMKPEIPRMAAASSRVSLEYLPITSQESADQLVDDEVEVLISPRAPRDLRRVPSLRWLALASAGVEHFAADPPWRHGIIVTNAAGAYALPIAQYVLTEILRIAGHVETRREAQLAHHWATPAEERDYTAILVHKQTLLIVGYGGIGREVARLAKAFGMRVLAVKNRPEMRTDRSFRLAGTGDPEGVLPDRLEGLDALERFLGEADYVALTLPLTDRSRGIVSRSRLALIRPDAWLINIGRGPLVDEAALIEALRERRIGGAVLDVFGTEPLPADSPYWSLPNTVVTPHVSGADITAPEILAELFGENLRRYAAGDPLINVIDADLQY